MPPTKRQLEQISRFARDYYRKLDQTHGIEHMDRSIKLAEHLAKKENANIWICRLGAMLHQFHKGKTVRQFLEK